VKIENGGDKLKRTRQLIFLISPGITISPSPNMENGLAGSAVGNKSCEEKRIIKYKRMFQLFLNLEKNTFCMI